MTAGQFPEDRVKAGPVALLSLLVLALGAGPAAAMTPILAKAKPWHYWVSFVLAASFLGMAFMLGVGYLVRVVGPKYGVRLGKRSEE
jgi:membrane protein implicated in regulation of membrane protease activity